MSRSFEKIRTISKIIYIPRREKIWGIFVVGIFLLATFGTVSAEKQNTYARNPSIQNSKYYVLEFSIESNAEETFLVLDGEKHEMFNEDGKYVCRKPFKEGNHEYYFELDGKRLLEKGSYIHLSINNGRR